MAAVRSVPFSADALDGDWDPEEHDRRMAALFNDEYYGEAEEEAAAAAAAAAAEKRKADKKKAKKGKADASSDSSSEDDEEDEDEEAAGVPGWVYGDGPRPEWAGPSAEELAAGIDGFEGVVKGSAGAAAGGHGAYDDDAGEYGGDDDEEEVDPAVAGLHKRKRHQKRKSKTAAAKPGAMSAVERAKAEIAAERAARAGGKVSGGARRLHHATAAPAFSPIPISCTTPAPRVRRS